MKKIALLSALALCLGFTSCDDNDIVGIPQNPASAIFETSGLVMTPSADTEGTIDLKAYNDEAKNIPLSTLSITDFPADYELQIVMQISKDESFSRVTEVPTSIVDNVLYVTPDDLQGAYYANISKGPKEKTIYVRYAGYAVKGNTSVRLGDPSYYWPNGDASYIALSVLPFPSSLVIEDNYYLLGTINGWSVAEAIKMNHSDESPYDDPVFTLKVDITAEQISANSGWWWKIVPESTYITGNWVDGDNTAYGVAVNGDEALSGMLVGRTATEDCGAGAIQEAGPFLLTINMEEGTYDFSLAIENLWTPGNSNGWSQDASQMLYTSDYTNYQGYAHLNGDFKFSSQNNWDGINYGSAAEEGKLSNDGGAGNLVAPADALYWCNVNIASLTYSLYQVTTIGAIGDFNGWGASVALTPSADFLVWEGDVDFGDGAGSWKFRCNDDWTVNLGGDFNELLQDGANLAAPGAGVHHITLDLSTLSPTGKGYALYVD